MHKNLSKAFEAMHAMLYHMLLHLKFFQVTFWYPNLELIVPLNIYITYQITRITMEVLFLSILLNKFVRLYKNLIQRSIIEKSNLEAQYPHNIRAQ